VVNHPASSLAQDRESSPAEASVYATHAAYYAALCYAAKYIDILRQGHEQTSIIAGVTSEIPVLDVTPGGSNITRGRNRALRDNRIGLYLQYYNFLTFIY